MYDSQMKPSASMILVLSLLPVFVFSAYAERQDVEIPFGAYNPELNTPAEEWYSPTILTVKVGDEVFWHNDDREGHTVTSGQGSGRFGWMGDDYGTADGFFDSGRFMPGESWSRIFSQTGTFQYFCSIHPWMEGFIVVEPLIPDYPHDAAGNKIEFPVVGYTQDGLIELDITWEPNIIKTNERIALVYQTYDPQTNSNLDKMSYNMTVTQNGDVIFKDKGITSVGGDYRYVVFDESGPVEIIFEDIKSWGSSGIESSIRDIEGIAQLRTVTFTTIVYENPDYTAVPEMIIQPRQTFQFYYEIAVLIIVVPAILFVFVLIRMKNGPKEHQVNSAAI